MFHVYARKSGESKPKKIGPEYTSPGPAREYKKMLQSAGYLDVTIRQKFCNEDANGNRLYTKTGKERVSTKIVA